MDFPSYFYKTGHDEILNHRLDQLNVRPLLVSIFILLKTWMMEKRRKDIVSWTRAEQVNCCWKKLRKFKIQNFP